MSVLFCSDTHFGHLNIISYTDRPYKSVDHMNSALVDNWNSVVGPDDEVIFLGDFAMGKIDETLPIALRLNGSKTLVAGNHDRCWRFGHKNVPEWRQRYTDVGFTIADEQSIVEFDGTEILLCHFPYQGDSHDEDRYLAARPYDLGMPLFCGHTHASKPLSFSSKGTPMVNVGVDAWHMKPVSLDTLLGLLDGKETS